MLFATLVSSAASINRQRGCRVGTPNPQFSIHRSPLLSGGENPYIGNRRQLVVMASFQDQDFLEDHDATLQTWNKVFNAENYAEGKYAGSVHDYFLAQMLLNGNVQGFQQYLGAAQQYGGYRQMPLGYQDAMMCIQKQGNLPGSAYGNYVKRMMAGRRGQ